MKKLNTSVILAALAAFIGVPAIAEEPAKPSPQKHTLAMLNSQKSVIAYTPVKLIGSMFFLIETKVNGVPAKMLVDTGASHTTLDLNWVQQTFPQAQVRLATLGDASDPYAFTQSQLPLLPVEKFSVGESRFSELFMPLVNLIGLRNALPELNDVVGVLGMNTMGAAPCRISFKARTLQWLDAAALEKLGKKEKLQTTPRPGTNCMMVNVFSPKDGKPLSVLLDCGATVSRVPEAFWTSALPEKQQRTITTANGMQVVDIAFGVPADMKLSPNFAVKNVCPQLEPQNGIPKYLLGLDVLSQTDLLIDAENQALYAILSE